MAHYFTREEAEALLPQIVPLLHTIQALRLQMRESTDELEALRARAMGNGHHLQERISQVQATLAQCQERMRSTLEELYAYGCELKDADTGLIDFLSLRSGREVYLCWQLGEERIAYWHYLDAGFAGRQPLD